MVPPDMFMDMMPENDMGTPKPSYMEGQADPSRESGSPRLINDRYMMGSKRLSIASSVAELSLSRGYFTHLMYLVNEVYAIILT